MFSVPSAEFETDLGPTFQASIPFKNISADDISDICTGNCTHDELMKIATKFADGVIIENGQASQSVMDYAKSINKPMLMSPEEDYAQAYSDFYETLMP